MKKSNLWVGLTELVLGLAALAAVFLWVEGPLGSLLCGLGGGLLGSGGNLVWKYWKWTRPQNAERYREKLEQEEIDLRDERKKLLRCKAGLYAYQLVSAGPCGVLPGCLPDIAAGGSGRPGAPSAPAVLPGGVPGVPVRGGALVLPPAGAEVLSKKPAPPSDSSHRYIF